MEIILKRLETPPIILRRFEITWIPFYPKKRRGARGEVLPPLGPQLYKEIEVTERVTVEPNVSGLFIDGRPYELVAERFTITPGVYGGIEGPFSMPYFKPFDPIFGHTLELRFETDKGTFTWSKRWYFGYERVIQAAMAISGIAATYYAHRKGWI